MTQRTILRGADSIRFLGDHGFTFTLPYGRTKDKMPKGWNRPGAGHTVDEAIAHFERGNNIGALSEHGQLIDLDYFFPEQVAKLGDFARTARVWRNNAKERGGLIYRVIDGPVRGATWTPEGADSPHAELKAQNSKGNYDQKNVAGWHNGGEYLIVDAQFGVMEITRADLITIWRILAGVELYAPKPAKTHNQHYNCKTDNYKVDRHDSLAAQVKAHWTPLAVFERFGWVQKGTEEEGGETRINGHGGLLCKPNGLWHSFKLGVGGDSIDAWAVCIHRDRDRYFVDILKEMADAAGIEVPQRFRDPEPTPLPAGAEVCDNGVIVLKTTPTPEPTPLPALPACTPATCTTLRQGLNSPEGRELLHDLPTRTREVYVVVLSVLLTYAAQRGKWTLDLATRDLGVLLGKTHVSAARNLHALDRVGLVAYRHGAVQVEAGDAPPMNVDLAPICYKLLDVTRVNQQSSRNVTEDLNPISTSCNVYERFACDGEFADATMRANPTTKGLHGRVLRNINAGALNGLDHVATGELALTRRQLVDELGVSPGSAAGMTRVWVELGIAEVEKRGRVNEYVFSPDWQQQLEVLVPKMASFLAMYRVKICNLSDRITEVERHIRRQGGDPKQVREDDPLAIRDLHTRKKKMLFARQCLINEMVAKDNAHRPQATPQPETQSAPPKFGERISKAAAQPQATTEPSGWVGTPLHRPARTNKRSVTRRVSEGDLLERRLAVYAQAREGARVAA